MAQLEPSCPKATVGLEEPGAYDFIGYCNSSSRSEENNREIWSILGVFFFEKKDKCTDELHILQRDMKYYIIRAMCTHYMSNTKIKIKTKE